MITYSLKQNKLMEKKLSISFVIMWFLTTFFPSKNKDEAIYDK